jgi:hypothetical protein
LKQHILPPLSGDRKYIYIYRERDIKKERAKEKKVIHESGRKKKVAEHFQKTRSIFYTNFSFLPLKIEMKGTY